MAAHSSILAWEIPWAWWVTVHGVTKNQARLRLSMHRQEGRGAACVAFQTGPSAKLTASLSLGLFTCKAQVTKPSREDAVGEWNGARYEGCRVELMQDEGSGFSWESLSVLGALSGSAGVLRDGSGAQGDMSSKETLPPQVCSGHGSCCRWDILGAGDQLHGKLGISVVFQSVELLSFLQDPKLIV